MLRFDPFFSFVSALTLTRIMETEAPAEVGEETLPRAQGVGGGAALWWNESESRQKIYVDRQFFASFEDQVSALRGSKTVYVGNLSFYTTEAQIFELCARCGPVKRIVMGLNRNTKTPCGFCFVEYFSAEAALESVARVTGLVLDDRILRAELDFGFREGRQYGRGQSGGQVRDDRRLVYDRARSTAQTMSVDEDPDKAETRKKRFAEEPDAPPDETVTAKRRRGDDDDDDDDDEEK